MLQPKVGNKGFTFSLHEHSVPTILITSLFVARVGCAVPPVLGLHQEMLDRFFRSWKLVAQTLDRHPAGFGLTAVGLS